jgi:hypothetical protein
MQRHNGAFTQQSRLTPQSFHSIDPSQSRHRDRQSKRPSIPRAMTSC